MKEQEPRISLAHGDALDQYDSWPSPTCIMVDGPYGVSGYPTDPPSVDGLADWYAPHIAQWSRRATPETSLWFWGTELSWATVHPVLLLHGFEYQAVHVWDKGLAHIAGNVNGETIRQFPISTEVCALYTKAVRLRSGDGDPLELKHWLRAEWKRSGLPLSQTNAAAGVKNAATRKWFTACHLWYFPPPESMERLAFHARRHGKPTDRPYFSLDGKSQLTAGDWARMRSKWNHRHGYTNVWKEPPVHGPERVKAPDGRYVHANQKPLNLLRLAVAATTDLDDMIWEPFAGLAGTALVADELGRRYRGSEINGATYEAARQRLAAQADSVTGVALGASASSPAVPA